METLDLVSLGDVYSEKKDGDGNLSNTQSTAYSSLNEGRDRSSGLSCDIGIIVLE
ncbi:hypothetical protein [Solitalea canadensis]|nr:hypothetical protein [Solitalea canadensis]